MVWVTWRQHRVALGAVGALLGALAVWMWILGRGLHHAYLAATACHPTGSLACLDLVQHLQRHGQVPRGWLRPAGATRADRGVPRRAAAGPRARERHLPLRLDTEASEPGAGRSPSSCCSASRSAAAGGAVSVLFSWYYQPYFRPDLVGGDPFSLTSQSSPLAAGLFDLRGPDFAAWTLAAFAIGGLAGALSRRVVPAIACALAAYTGLGLAAALYLRAHYLAPIVTTSLNVPGSAWIIDQRWLTEAGRPASTQGLSHVLETGGSQLAGKGGVPESLGSWQYLVQHGYRQWTTYQPASRFWSLQWSTGAGCSGYPRC